MKNKKLSLIQFLVFVHVNSFSPISNLLPNLQSPPHSLGVIGGLRPPKYIHDNKEFPYKSDYFS